ncbi:MAG TPA: hypothetical protein VGM90_34400 [Kofleriaceae bacterium]|jgi:hypothetical protein
MPRFTLLASALALCASLSAIALANPTMEVNQTEAPPAVFALRFGASAALGSGTSVQGRDASLFFELEIAGEVWVTPHIAIGLRGGGGIQAAFATCDQDSNDPQMNCLQVETEFLEPTATFGHEWFRRGSIVVTGVGMVALGYADKKNYLSYPGDVYAGGKPDMLLTTERGLGAAASVGIDAIVMHVDVQVGARAKGELGNVEAGPYLAIGGAF